MYGDKNKEVNGYMSDTEQQEEKIKLVRPPQKDVHFLCDKSLYNEFKKLCYNSGKTPSACLRAYMKGYVGE